MQNFRGVLVCLALSSLSIEASANVESSALRSVSGVGGANHGADYTTNAVCQKRFCINPVFPSLEYFGQNLFTANQNRTWSCSDSSSAWRLTGFCSRITASYDFAMPVAEGEQTLTTDAIKEQTRSALLMYTAHLAGMGYDFWDYTEPWDANDCIKEVWKLSCYTAFPKCNLVDPGQYLRPCRSSCENYLKACKVECCDEGVQCVFTHVKHMSNGVTQVDEGYTDHHGPSPMCTGAAASLTGGLTIVVFLFLALIA